MSVAGDFIGFPNSSMPISCLGCGDSSLGGIALGPDGNLWFTERGRNRIARLGGDATQVRNVNLIWR